MLLFIVLISALSCNSQDCETIPKTYTSYTEALSTIKNTSFNYTDSVNTSSSSWITDANYYSCDETKGFLIIETTKKNYIFKNVPIQIWHNFKDASSFGKFYSKFIRGKYQLVI